MFTFFYNGRATSAESSIKYMQVKYMQDHKDQEFWNFGDFGLEMWCGVDDFLLVSSTCARRSKFSKITAIR
jgi:hypothetical protein